MKHPNVVIDMPKSVKAYVRKYCETKRNISKSDLISAFINYGSNINRMQGLHKEAIEKGAFENMQKENEAYLRSYSKAILEHANSVHIIVEKAKPEYNDAKPISVSLHATTYGIIVQWCKQKNINIGDMAKYLLWYGFINEIYSLNILHNKNDTNRQYRELQEIVMSRVWTLADEDRLDPNITITAKEKLLHGLQKAPMLRNINPNNLLTGRDAFIRVMKKTDEPGAYEKIWHLEDFADKYLINTPKNKSKGVANVIKN